eukprot:4567207-Pyramimonas_sp.AAC.1
MAERVDLTDAAPEGCESSDSGIASVTGQTDAPIDPKYAVAEDQDLSPERGITHRAQSVGWIKTSIVARRSATTYLLSG